jgi:glycosyltransferase involved in cell wall biosynthesis
LTDRILVADDPQVVPLIPRVKKDFPETRIIFRSHIQIQSDLTDDPSTEQAHVWDYLFGFIKHSDMFLAHPVDFFIPKNVKDSLPVLYMPPSTDPLDGLNKPMGKEVLGQIRQVYNSISSQQCQVEIDWDRGYFLQVARFDPSKGLDDLLAAYLQFRQKIEEAGEEGDRKPPQLIVVGHGSVDDPDGTRLYEECHKVRNWVV